MKKIGSVPIFIFLTIFLFSCGKTPQKSKKGRFVSLSPAITEILYAIGAEENLLGVTNQCNWPPDVKIKEKVGDFSYPSLEKIVQIAPDVIFAAGMGQMKTIKKIESLGYKIFIFEPSNIQEFLDGIIEIGKITGCEKKARNLVSNLKKEMEIMPKTEKGKIFIEVSHKPLIAASKNTFLSSVVEYLGFDNICVSKEKYPFLSVEWVISRKPSFILLTSCKKEKFLSTHPYFEKTRIIEVNPDLIVRPGPRIVEGMWQILAEAK